MVWWETPSPVRMCLFADACENYRRDECDPRTRSTCKCRYWKKLVPNYPHFSGKGGEFPKRLTVPAWKPDDSGRCGLECPEGQACRTGKPKPFPDSAKGTRGHSREKSMKHNEYLEANGIDGHNVGSLFLHSNPDPRIVQRPRTSTAGGMPAGGHDFMGVAG